MVFGVSDSSLRMDQKIGVAATVVLSVGGMALSWVHLPTRMAMLTTTAIASTAIASLAVILKNMPLTFLHEIRLKPNNIIFPYLIRNGSSIPYYVERRPPILQAHVPAGDGHVRSIPNRLLHDRPRAESFHGRPSVPETRVPVGGGHVRPMPNRLIHDRPRVESVQGRPSVPETRVPVGGGHVRPMPNRLIHDRPRVEGVHGRPSVPETRVPVGGGHVPLVSTFRG